MYLTMGTEFASPEVLRTAIAGLERLPARVLVSSGPRVDVPALGELPASVTVLPWVPQADLLPYVDLVVHHGGSGTTLASLGAGVPQLLLPQGADQFVNADAVAKRGVGVRLDGPDVTADAIATTAEALLGGSNADELASVAGEVAAMPAPEEVAARLMDIAR